MCGRFTLSAPGDALAEVFELDDVPEAVPRYNIAPTQPVLVVRARGPRRVAETLAWGVLFPAKGGRRSPLLINARAETLGTQPAWREALSERRCLIPADGFYEWHGEGDARQPWYIARGDGRPFAFAGVWQPQFGPDGKAACTIVTTAPLPPVSAIHDRMPLLVSPDEHALWLDRQAPRDAIARLLRTPPRADALVAHPVGRAVNSAKNDDPSLREPAAAAASGPRQRGLF
ncbi:MAG: SOS response-associated peptidase [Vicinamibacteria bacterium]